MAEAAASRSGAASASLRLAVAARLDDDDGSRSKPDSRSASPTRTTLASRKREATAAGLEPGSRTSRRAGADKKDKHVLPARYGLEQPKRADVEPARNTLFGPHEPAGLTTPDGLTDLLRPIDHAHNVKSFRYQACVADPAFPHKQFFRSTDVGPTGPRLSFEDSDKGVRFDRAGMIATSAKGWRSTRANVWARQGRWYMEVTIVRGLPADPAAPAGPSSSSAGRSPPTPHVRVGFSRREASLDFPVGFDSFSYAVCDSRLEAMHRSRPRKIASGPDRSTAGLALPDHIRTGDTIGLEISLPSLAAHRRVVMAAATADDPMDVVRDRIPIPFRGVTYFESFEYQPTKGMDTYNDRSLQGAVVPQPSKSAVPAGSTATPTSTAATGSASTKPTPTTTNTPCPSHQDPSLRTLPTSSVKVWINGSPAGAVFENLLAFLPPASSVPSQPAPGLTGRPGLDDGTLGYYPTISMFYGGIAKVNFGPHFAYPPDDLATARTRTDDDGDVDLAGPATLESTTTGPVVAGDNHEFVLRPFSERYDEQVGEDIVWDLVDEATFFVVDGSQKDGGR